MATKSGRSTTGTRKQPGRAKKGVKLPAKRSKAGAKRGSAKKAPSKEGGRGAKAAGEPRFYLFFKAKASQDIYLVEVYDNDKLTNDKLNPGKTLNDLEEALSHLPVTVEFAYLLKKNDVIFRTCGPSH